MFENAVLMWMFGITRGNERLYESSYFSFAKELQDDYIREAR
jgi:hypothetical protein